MKKRIQDLSVTVIKVIKDNSELHINLTIALPELLTLFHKIGLCKEILSEFK